NNPNGEHKINGICQVDHHIGQIGGDKTAQGRYERSENKAYQQQKTDDQDKGKTAGPVDQYLSQDRLGVRSDGPNLVQGNFEMVEYPGGTEDQGSDTDNGRNGIFSLVLGLGDHTLNGLGHI